MYIYQIRHKRSRDDRPRYAAVYQMFTRTGYFQCSALPECVTHILHAVLHHSKLSVLVPFPPCGSQTAHAHAGGKEEGPGPACTAALLHLHFSTPIDIIAILPCADAHTHTRYTQTTGYPCRPLLSAFVSFQSGLGQAGWRWSRPHSEFLCRRTEHRRYTPRVQQTSQSHTLTTVFVALEHHPQLRRESVRPVQRPSGAHLLPALIFPGIEARGRGHTQLHIQLLLNSASGRTGYKHIRFDIET